MSKNKKSGKKGRGKQIGDVTINDFANAAVCSNRPKKSVSSVTTVIKKLEESDKAWYERDDIDADFDFVTNKNEDLAVLCENALKLNLEVSGASTNYPLDVWFLISEYIRPEDVANFAGICKSTLAVVQSAKFWFHLYKRYYKNVPNLPEQLQPSSLVRFYGLKTSVIKSLHYMYPPFVKKLKPVTSTINDPHSLMRRQCVLMWTKKYGKSWIYSFKLKQNMNNNHPHYRNNNNNTYNNRLDMLDDISANPDENCKLLEVTSQCFLHIPLALGLTLTSSNLSNQYTHYKLTLEFSSGLKGYAYKTLDGSNVTKIVLDPVTHWKILDWWHPQFPHTNSIDYLLNLE